MSRIHLSLPNAFKLLCFDKNINGKRYVKFLIGIIGHCTALTRETCFNMKSTGTNHEAISSFYILIKIFKQSSIRLFSHADFINASWPCFYEEKRSSRPQILFSNFSCMFLVPNNFSQFEFKLF